MKIVFYSDKCEYCKKLMEYLNKHNIKSLFQLINIDSNEVPDEIDSVPTIVDSDLNQPLKGKKVFEYLINIKYFNNPTNNIESVKELPQNPIIDEDDKANNPTTTNLNILTESTIPTLNNNLDLEEKRNESLDFYEANKNISISNSSQSMVALRQNQDKKLTLLLQMRRR